MRSNAPTATARAVRLSELTERCCDASARSSALVARSVLLREAAIVTRLSSRPRGHYARVVGSLSGAVVTGIVREDGALDGDPALVAHARAGLLTAAAAPTPLAATLRLSRACDLLSSVALHFAGRRGADMPAAVAMHRPEEQVPHFSTSEREVDGHRVVAFYGELDLADAERAEQALVAVAGSSVVLDLSGLRFLDAAGLGAIVHASERIEAEGGALRTRGASGIVRRIFEVTSLCHLLGD
ncbi:MAG: STAS domain-containing protein [Acidimicrobiales bacterium]